MIGLLQRVDGAAVEVEGREIARIGKGLLVLVGVERGDDEAVADRLLERLTSYRVFSDGEGRMNLSVADAGGALQRKRITHPEGSSRVVIGKRPVKVVRAGATDKRHLADQTELGAGSGDIHAKLRERLGAVEQWARGETTP